MTSLTLPAVEAVRADAVRRWRLLQLPSEPFERIISLAMRATGAKAGGIGVFGEAGVRLVASVGWTERAFPLADSLGARLVVDGAPRVVPDARLVPEFRDNRFVTGSPFVRSVAGCPIAPAYGIPVAALVLVHDEPNRFEPDAIEAVETAAAMAEHEIRQFLLHGPLPADAPGGSAEPPADATPVLRSPHARFLFKKWSPQIFAELRAAPSLRFGDLMQRLPGISSRTLSDRLKEMQAAGLVEREQSATIPVRVSYRLTPEGLAVSEAALPLLANEGGQAAG